jgi:hypothetical protein
MHAQRGLSRGLWLLVAIAVGISYIGRPLTMRAGVQAAQQATQRQALAQHHAGMAGHAGEPMPCQNHSGECCAPCLACCPGCVTPPLPAAAPTAGAVAAVVRLASTDRTPVLAPRSGNRHLQPPPIGPPTPLVS